MAKAKTTPAPTKKRPPRAAGNPPDSPWRSTTNAKRNREMLTLTPGPGTKELLEWLTGKLDLPSRSAVVDALALEKARALGWRAPAKKP